MTGNCWLVLWSLTYCLTNSASYVQSTGNLLIVFIFVNRTGVLLRRKLLKIGDNTTCIWNYLRRLRTGISRIKFPDLVDASWIFLSKLFISVCFVFLEKVSDPFLTLVGTWAQLHSEEVRDHPAPQASTLLVTAMILTMKTRLISAFME